jgi:hypothetical protein
LSTLLTGGRRRRRFDKKKKKKKKKTSQPMKKLEIKITNLRFASLFVEI